MLKQQQQQKLAITSNSLDIISYSCVLNFSHVTKQMSYVGICVSIKRLITCENVQFTRDYFYFKMLKFEFTCEKKVNHILMLQTTCENCTANIR